MSEFTPLLIKSSEDLFMIAAAIPWQFDRKLNAIKNMDGDIVAILVPPFVETGPYMVAAGNDFIAALKEIEYLRGIIESLQKDQTSVEALAALIGKPKDQPLAQTVQNAIDIIRSQQDWIERLEVKNKHLRELFGQKTREQVENRAATVGAAIATQLSDVLESREPLTLREAAARAIAVIEGLHTTEANLQMRTKNLEGDLRATRGQLNSLQEKHDYLRRQNEQMTAAYAAAMGNLAKRIKVENDAADALAKAARLDGDFSLEGAVQHTIERINDLRRINTVKSDDFNRLRAKVAEQEKGRWSDQETYEEVARLRDQNRRLNEQLTTVRNLAELLESRYGRLIEELKKARANYLPLEPEIVSFAQSMDKYIGHSITPAIPASPTPLFDHLQRAVDRLEKAVIEGQDPMQLDFLGANVANWVLQIVTFKRNDDEETRTE